MYSIIQSAKKNGLKVEAYLSYVFEIMSKTKENDWTSVLIQALVPHSNSLPKELYTQNKTVR